MNRNTSETTEPVGPGQTEEKFSSASPSPSPKVFLYTIPAIVLALFAWLVFSKVQARQRVRARRSRRRRMPGHPHFSGSPSPFQCGTGSQLAGKRSGLRRNPHLRAHQRLPEKMVLRYRR